MKAAVVLVAFSLLAPNALLAQQTPTRDQPRFTSSGTAVVRGTVVADDATRTPLRRAQVTLSRIGAEDIRSASTDDQGQFAFADLPAATYSLGAAKGGFIAMSAGAVKPGMPGRQVIVGEGAAVMVSPIALPRGAVIAGRIVDSAGQPVSNAQVQASRFVTVNGERQARSGSNALWVTSTNDHGDYRLFGLLAGDYIVAALQPGTTFQSDITAADVEAAQRPVTAGVTVQPAPVPRPFALAHTLYPGTVDESAATPIVLKPGEERLGVDVSLLRVPVARVSGTVLGLDGRPLPGVSVVRRLRRLPNFTPVSSTGVNSAADGSFSLIGVSPGDYELQARANPGRDAARAEQLSRVGLANPPSPATQGPPQWASADLAVNGADISGVTLRMQPGITISGRMTTTSARVDVSRARIQLGTSGGAPGFVSGNADAQGAFLFDGIPPGRYTLSFPGLQAGVVARSAMLGEVDLLDGPFEIRPGGNLSGIAITLTDVRTELGGILTNSSGQPASHLYVLAFSQDRAHWIRDSRRILSARAGEDGSYTISGLPAGNYFLCALTEIDTTLQFEGEYLDQLVPASLKITLADGEKKVQHLRAGG